MRDSNDPLNNVPILLSKFAEISQHEVTRYPRKRNFLWEMAEAVSNHISLKKPEKYELEEIRTPDLHHVKVAMTLK